MNRRRRPSKAHFAGRAGAAAVEMALVSPIIFLMFLGAVELTNLDFIRNTAANAVYEGARASMVSGGTSADGNAAVMAYLSKVGVHHGATANSSVTNQDVTVSVTIPMQLNSFGISRFTTGYNVTQAITLRREMAGDAE